VRTEKPGKKNRRKVEEGCKDKKKRGKSQKGGKARRQPGGGAREKDFKVGEATGVRNIGTCRETWRPVRLKTPDFGSASSLRLRIILGILRTGGRQKDGTTDGARSREKKESRQSVKRARAQKNGPARDHRGKRREEWGKEARRRGQSVGEWGLEAWGEGG